MMVVISNDQTKNWLTEFDSVTQNLYADLQQLNLRKGVRSIRWRLTVWLTNWLTDWLIDWLTDWLIDWFKTRSYFESGAYFGIICAIRWLTIRRPNLLTASDHWNMGCDHWNRWAVMDEWLVENDDVMGGVSFSKWTFERVIGGSSVAPTKMRGSTSVQRSIVRHHLITTCQRTYNTIRSGNRLITR